MERILFIGNSFTYYNDLPKMLETLSQQAGFDIKAHSVTKGGWYLSRYANPEDDYGQLLRAEYPKETWDYIVLQDQSANPALQPEDFLTASHALCTLFPCRKQHVFYQTWAYEDGSAKLATVNMDYEAFHQALAASYNEAVKRENALCAPVGDAFALCHARYPRIQLYVADSYHPSLNGTYLAACVFYATLTGKDPAAIADYEGLTPDEARQLREIARDTFIKD